jgi:hypothetical protein
MTQATVRLETAKHGSRHKSAEGQAPGCLSRLVMAACAVWVCAFYNTAYSAGGEAERASVVRHIDIVHMTHTDIGFTDHPPVCRRQPTAFQLVRHEPSSVCANHVATRDTTMTRQVLLLIFLLKVKSGVA